MSNKELEDGRNCFNSFYDKRLTEEQINVLNKEFSFFFQIDFDTYLIKCCAQPYRRLAELITITVHILKPLLENIDEYGEDGYSDELADECIHEIMDNQYIQEIIFKKQIKTIDLEPRLLVTRESLHRTLMISEDAFDNTVYFLIGKWFTSNDSENAFAYFSSMYDELEKHPNTLIIFGLPQKLEVATMLKSMIKQLNDRQGVPFINDTATIKNWFKLVNEPLYLSEYRQKCKELFTFNCAVTDKTIALMNKIADVIYHFIFITVHQTRMLGYKAAEYFKIKRTDTDDTTDKTDRNPD